MSKVFVSYKRDDKDIVLPIVHRMEDELGFKFWVDLKGIESDEQFSNVIVHAINKCEVFLFLFSKSQEKIVRPPKDWTVREINYADKKDKRIVFMKIEECVLHDWFLLKFPDQEIVDANDDFAIGKLVNDMRRWLYPTQSPTSSKSQNTEAVSTSVNKNIVTKKASSAEKLPKVYLRRKYNKVDYCIGSLFIMGGKLFFCNTMEPRVSQNELSHTDKAEAIQAGVYEVRFCSMEHSTKGESKENLVPCLSNVPYHTHIYMRPGTTADDTDGDILLGFNSWPGLLKDSESVCSTFYKRMEGKPFLLIITNDFEG